MMIRYCYHRERRTPNGVGAWSNERVITVSIMYKQQGKRMIKFFNVIVHCERFVQFAVLQITVHVDTYYMHS